MRKSACTTVVNKRREDYDVYIGRGSRFGNPHQIGPDGDRDEVIRKFDYDFHTHLLKDPAFVRALETLRGRRLGCFCKPARCHGDVLAAYLNGEPRLVFAAAEEESKGSQLTLL